MIRTALFSATLLLASTCLTVAQTTPAPAPAPPVSATTNSTVGTGTDQVSGFTMAEKAPAPARFITLKPGNLTTDDLIGAKVVNNQNESLGEVEDLLIDSGKTVSGVILSVGGFLGMGESYVLVDPASVAVNKVSGEDYKLVIDATKDSLKSAPKFAYPRD
ncbi:MAG: photosystem reaction center subunit [Hyphomicrobiales bacterium]|nr:photosystem reaction center subunit [Hyphomicrobiales bacterium]